MRRAKEIHAEESQDHREHLLDRQGIRCPFFEEVLVAFCRAFPVKKMIPSDRLNATCVCVREGFEDCMLFREVMAKFESSEPAGGTIQTKNVEEAESSAD